MVANLLGDFLKTISDPFEQKLTGLPLDTLIPMYNTSRTFVRGLESLFSGLGTPKKASTPPNFMA